MLPAMISTSYASLIRRTISITPVEWPWAVSTTSTSTSASTRAPARSKASVPTPTAAADAEAALLVLRRERVLDPLADVLDRDQAAQPPVGVDDRQLLDPVPVQDRVRLVERRPDRCGDEVPARHQLGDRLARVGLEAQVAVGEDADEHVTAVGDRDPRDLVARHQLERVGDERVRPQRHRLDDHPRLGPLDLVDLGDLVLDREVAMDDAEPALARQRNREPRLGDRVHRSRDDRDLERDRAGEARGRADVVRQHGRLGRQEQDVVEGQAFFAELRVPIEVPVQR